ncbi:MAG TPA: DUF4272 domain-containing protein [Candidatus Corynebacterium gallistercoris]|uniref:DUF4272 domain-containing protein n=1 Tax=Candidatus Corynebacterium gallistercoris TaxID=2838530 RepID=A0A9D1RZ12_9CORY|nr:DUF4272 domain-containing protein [Candidatus Corynebacterium gallistercoris]
MSIYINAYCTVREPVPFHPTSPGGEATAVRSLEQGSPESQDMYQHLKGFEGFATQQGTDRGQGYNGITHGVVQHIRAVKTQYVFDRPDNYSPTDLQEFAGWAEKTNPIFFMPDGTVRNAQGRDLLDPATPLEAVPHPPEAYERMRRVRGDLWNRGFKVAPSLPPVTSEREAQVRPPEQILNRAVTLAVVATIAGKVLDGEPVDLQAIRAGSTRTFENLTEPEQHFISRVESLQGPEAVEYPQDVKDAAGQLVWSMMAAEIMAWALGLVEMDTTTIQPADIPALRAGLRSVDREGRSASDLSLVELPELCDVWERTFSLRWYAVDQDIRQRNGQATEGAHLEPAQASALLERHRALAWMLDPFTEYTEVDLST